MNGEPDEVEADFADVEVNVEKIEGDVRNSFKFFLQRRKTRSGGILYFDDTTIEVIWIVLLSFKICTEFLIFCIYKTEKYRLL